MPGLRDPNEGVAELTRASFQSGNERDYEAMTSRFAPDCELDVASMGLGSYLGKRAIRRFYEDWIGAFDSWHVELEEVSDLGGGVVLVVASQTGRSGPLAFGRRAFHVRHAVVYEWLGGLAVRVTNYIDLVEARRAAWSLAAQRLEQRGAAGELAPASRVAG